MRIALIAADLIPEKLGGAESHVIEVVKRLSRRGYEFELFVGPETRIKDTLPENVAVHPVRYPKIPNLYGISYMLSAPGQIGRIMDKRRFDLVWAKEVFPQAVVAARLARKRKLPIYVTTQNPRLHYEELVIKGRFLVPMHHVFAALLDPLISWAVSQADVVAAVSKDAQRKALRYGAGKTLIIPNGVEIHKFKMTNENIKMRRPIRIVTTSSLIPRNGLDTLIDAVALLPKSLDWELIIAGEGPEEEKLKLQMKKYKLEKNIMLLGRLENRKIPALLASADLFIRLSRKEGFGVSFLEAMAAGVPVVATAVGGIPDIIEDQQNGLLVAPDAPRQAAKAIERLLTDEKLYAGLSHNGIERVKKHFTWEKVTDEVHKAFQALA